MSEVVLQKIQNDSSIEIAKNSRGFTYSVKAYGSTEVEIAAKLRNLTKTASDLIKEIGEDSPSS